MKNLLYTILALLMIGSGQTMTAASHQNMVREQTHSAPIYNAKQEKKIEKLERKLERKRQRKEHRNTKWGNIALIVGSFQVALFAVAVIATFVVFWEFMGLFWIWMLWGVVWMPSVIFSIIAMVLADRNGDTKERNKALIAFFLGLVPVLYGAFKIIEFFNDL